MNDGDILDMMNQLKDKYDMVEKKEQKIKEQLLQFTKSLCGIYGLIRIIDNVIDERPVLVDCLINEIRAEISDLLFKNENEDEN